MLPVNSKKKTLKKQKVSSHLVLPQTLGVCGLVATCLGLGRIGGMPGTIGSLIALPIWILIFNIFRVYFVPLKTVYIFWTIFLVFLFIAGACAANCWEKKMNIKDPSSIIIDEVVGQLLALVLTQHIIINYLSENYMMNVIIYGIFCFLNLVLFRLFDIFKPSAIGWADKKIKGGYGVMIDDLLAAAAAAIVINISIFVLLYIP